MTIGRACFSDKKVYECIYAIKELSKTVKIKRDHLHKAFEVKKVYDLCLEKTGCISFMYEYTACNEYIKALDRNASKEELDSFLRESVNYLKREISGIKNAMDKGEVDVIN